MNYFSEDTLFFLNGLSNNNNRAWFNANKSRFKVRVETPFKDLVSDLINELQPFIPNLNVHVKDCVFRIYRDTRFSSDKSPYKNYVSALINSGGRKNKTTPGLYIEFSGESLRIHSGCFKLKPDQIEKIRISIFNNLESFKSLINNEKFKETFKHIRGEKYNRIPSKYHDLIDTQPLLLNKSFSYFKEYESCSALKDNILNIILDDFQNCLKLNEFFLEALKK